MKFIDKVIISDAHLTGSLFGTSSYSLTASYALNSITPTGLFTGSFTGSFIGEFTGSVRQPLTNGNILIGSGSDIATSKTITGDVLIDSNGVTTLGNNTVTYTKIQNVTGNRLLGRSDSSGVVQEITLGTNLSFTGTTLNVSPTSSYSLTSSRAITSSYSDTSISSSYALTASYALNGGGGNVFPYTGDAVITGNLNVTDSVTASFFKGDGSGLINLPTSAGGTSYSFPFSGQSLITVNHNLDTQYPIVQVYNSAGYMIVPQDIRVLNSGSIEVTFPTNTLSGSISVAKGGHIISGSLQNAVSASYAEYVQSPAVRTHTIPFGISSPLVITTGEKGLKTIGREGKIIGWRLISDVSTTATLDIWKTNSAIPTNSNSICASAKPSLTAGVFNSSTTLTGWTTTFTSNDVFRVEVESNNNSTYLLLELDFLVDNN